MPAVKHFSASAAKTYLLCPRKWHYKYVERLPDPAGPAAVRGTMVHEAVESYWRGEYHKPIAGIHRYIAAYRKMPGAATPEQVAHVELEVRATLPGLDVPMLGYIDCLTADGTIIDLKTAGRHWASTRALTELQPALYTWLAEANGYTVTGFEFHILIGDGADREIDTQRFTLDLSDEEIERHLAEVRQAWQGIVAGEFPTKRQVLCAWCNFQERCESQFGAGESIDESESP